MALVLCVIALAGCGSDEGGEIPTATATPTRTPTGTASATSTQTPLPTATASPSATATRTATETRTLTPTSTRTDTPSATASATSTATPTATVARTAVACEALGAAEVAGARILSALIVAGGGANPEYCKVSGRMDPALNFEVRLPAGWNRKVLVLGGGGYDGAVPLPEGLGGSPGVLRSGYVTIGTDSGHQGSAFDASWALNDTEAVQNFADLAWHRVLAVGREIVEKHYADSIRRTYFEGGSSGGREALIQAQRWPQDYDGVVAREPALSFTGLNLAANRIEQQLFRRPEAFLDATAVHVLSRAVLAACDGLDGLVDEIVSNLAACGFDPAVLLCTEGSGDCLTQDQIDTVRTVFSRTHLDFSLANGVTGHPGFPLSGAEDSQSGWPLWITGFSPASPSSLLFVLQDHFFKYFVTKNAQLDSLTFSAADATAELQSVSALLDATNADLSVFSSRGGKVILWHGLADYAISAYGTVEYYERVVSAAGGQESADEFVRFYTAPGVDHTAGGRGAPVADLLGALDAWADGGVAPGDLLAYRQAGAALAPTRPLCRYPTYPRYDGIGDPDSASSFVCVAP